MRALVWSRGGVALIAAIEQLALNPPENSAVDWSAVLAALAGM